MMCHNSIPDTAPPFEPFSFWGMLCPGRRQRLARFDMATLDAEEDYYDQLERWERGDDDEPSEDTESAA